MPSSYHCGRKRETVLPLLQPSESMVVGLDLNWFAYTQMFRCFTRSPSVYITQAIEAFNEYRNRCSQSSPMLAVKSITTSLTVDRSKLSYHIDTAEDNTTINYRRVQFRRCRRNPYHASQHNKFFWTRVSRPIE